MGELEGIIALIETGGLGVILYFLRRLQKKKEMLNELTLLVQTKNDKIQDLKNKIQLKDLEIKMLTSQSK